MAGGTVGRILQNEQVNKVENELMQIPSPSVLVLVLHLLHKAVGDYSKDVDSFRSTTKPSV